MLKEYGFIRVGAVVPEMKVADTEFNTKEIIKQIEIANKNKVQIVCFPELCITGYTCNDLFYQDILIDNTKNCISKIQKATEKIDMIVLIGAPIMEANQLFNTAVVIQKGKILGIVPKTHLPNSEEFYEKRWFTSGNNTYNQYIEINNEKVPFGNDLLFKDTDNKNICFGVEIGEDLCVANPPSNILTSNGATVIFNLSASNEILEKQAYRKSITSVQSLKTISGYIYCSSGVNESTTDSVFSGYSMIYENGNLLKENIRFDFESNMIFTEIDIKYLVNNRKKSINYMNVNNNEFRSIDIKIDDNLNDLTREYSKTPFIPEDDKKKIIICEETLNIQSLGLAKRLKETKIKKTVLGISGGLDSCLALLATIKAYDKLKLDKKDIITITMPGFGTSSKTYNCAKKLINELNTTFKEIDIKKACKQHIKDIEHSESTLDITYENLQARERMQILMDIANKENAIVVGTGDLSELAVGWCTYNGDHMSMYGINSGVPKTLIEHIIKYVADISSNEELQKVLYDILKTPISPELLPTDRNGNTQQLTEATIGSYKLNDFFLYHFLKHGDSPDKLFYIASKTFDEYNPEYIKGNLKNFLKRFFTNQFKRNCLPDGPKVCAVNLSPRGNFKMPSDASYKLWINF